MDSADYVDFGDVCRRRLNEQAQYGSRFVDGRHGCPRLGDGLRFVGDAVDYHSLRIHADDVEEFVGRYRRAVAAANPS